MGNLCQNICPKLSGIVVNTVAVNNNGVKGNGVVGDDKGVNNRDEIHTEAGIPGIIAEPVTNPPNEHVKTGTRMDMITEMYTHLKEPFPSEAGNEHDMVQNLEEMYVYVDENVE